MGIELTKNVIKMINFKSIKISAYKNFNSQNNPFEVSLWDWLFTEKYKDRILSLRNAPDAETETRIKTSLPCATPSGLFTPDLKLIKHSGFIVLDIDAKDNPDYTAEQMKEKISNFGNVAFAGYSCRGKGIFALVPIADPQKHLQHFRALQKVLGKHNIIIDNACSNINRLRFCSYDAEPYLNEDAEPFALVWIDEGKPKKKLTNYRRAPSDADPFDEFNQHGDVIGLLQNHGWIATHQKGDRIYLQRPDKAGRGISGNFNERLRLFTSWSNSTQFEANKAYNASGVFNVLECAGDWRECAKKLKDLDY